MLKEEMWNIFKVTGDIEAYLYYKKSDVCDLSNKKDEDLKEYGQKILQVQ